MIWSDRKRFYPTSGEKPKFPQADNYNNLDNYLHDVRMAVRAERAYRRTHQLQTLDDRYYAYLALQDDNKFDVI